MEFKSRKKNHLPPARVRGFVPQCDVEIEVGILSSTLLVKATYVRRFKMGASGAPIALVYRTSSIQHPAFSIQVDAEDCSLSSQRIVARGVRKVFGPTVAVDGVDFSVAAGEVRALVGENGAGKSTLVNVLSGVFLADAGSILLDGEAYEPSSPKDARDRGVVMVHQELALASHLTVAENLFLGIEPVRYGLLRRAEMRESASNALRELERRHLSGCARRFAFDRGPSDRGDRAGADPGG